MQALFMAPEEPVYVSFVLEHLGCALEKTGCSKSVRGTVHYLVGMKWRSVVVALPQRAHVRLQNMVRSVRHFAFSGVASFCFHTLALPKL